MKRIAKQLLILTIIMCAGINVCQAEAKSKSVVLHVGDIKKVSFLQANKKYTLSNKKIIKINKKGKIIALKKGRTKIYHNKKKICDVTVKNTYFVCDFKQAKRVVVTDLNYGKTFELGKDDIAALQDKLNNNRFYRVSKDKEKKKGGYAYSFSAYNGEKLIFKVVVGNNKMKYYSSPEQTTDCIYFSSSQNMEFPEFE